ncbi:SUKH-3 domain-containing protein [Solwaraspora sp. WMMB762]|uniref:SUKH-3 domain-containing protein n=1 Tax=Solwaraspora sp. WMMB762 TaxID=3404120 RepID=UPI003B95E71A
MTDGEVCGASFSEFLAGIGWTPGRQVGVGRIVSEWCDRGYVPSAAATDFVGGFDGISFEYLKHVVVGGFDECVLDAVRATGAVSPTRLHGYEGRVGQRLAPVGLAASNHVILMVAVSGQIFGAYDDFLALYGENGKVALWKIHHRVEVAHLPMA